MLWRYPVSDVLAEAVYCGASTLRASPWSDIEIEIEVGAGQGQK